MNPTAIFSKTGKGVQEASGKTSNLSRADRAVLKEIDGKTTHAAVAAKFEKIPAAKFDALIQQFDKDGYIREVSSGATAPQTPPPRSAPPPKAPPKAPPPSAAGDDDEMDFTQAIKLPPKAAPAAPKPPPVDLAAAARADAERKAKEQEGFDYKARQEAEAKAKAESDARARAEAQARAAAEAKARAESEAKARAESEAKTRAEADAKVKAARDAALRLASEAKAKADAESKAKAKLEAELTGKLEEERRAREDAERRAAEAAERARKDLEEKAKRDADELRQRLEAEMKAKLEEERKAREAEDRKRREEEDRRRAEEDRKRREEDERRRKEDEERRAKEAAERKAREEEDRKRREEDERRRKEEDERRAKEAEERKAREEADRKRREDEDRKRREEDERKRAEEEKRRKDEEARRAKEDADRRAKEDADRRAKDDADRRAKEAAEEKARTAASQSSSTPSIAPVAPPPPPPAPAAAGGLDDSLLADLDSFGKREEEEQKAKEEAEGQAKAEAARKAKAEADRRAKDDAERRAKEEADRKRREAEERKAQEEAEQRAREEEERKKEEEAERKRKAKESLAAKEAERKAAQRAAAAPKPGKPGRSAASAGDDDIGVTDDDLDMDDVKKDEKALSGTARKAQREREQAAAIAAAPALRPKKWGKPAAIALFVLLIGGAGVLQFMPVSTSEYEKAASEALGVPVKIGSARLSVITGIEARFDAVSIGDMVKIRTVRGYPEVGSLFGGKKSFSRIELEGVSLSQSQLADAVLGKVSGDNFRVGRILIKQAKLDGPLALPALDVEALVSGDGSLQSVSLRGGDKLVVQLSPKGNDIGFEISAGNLALPFAPALNLSDFGMKGTANRGGVIASEFDGRNFDGVISGTAKMRWGANWTVEGEVRARGIRVAVLAPALVSEGKVEGRGAYTMSGPNPATLFENARIQGEFKIDKGVLGSFDLTRALQTGGAQSSGRTVFSELTGQAVYDRGAVKVSNVAITAGAMNAGASVDIDANGGLSGRVVADVKMATQTLRATLNLSGKIQDPVIRK